MRGLLATSLIISTALLASCGGGGATNNMMAADAIGYPPGPDLTNAVDIVDCEPIGRRVAFEDCEAVKATQAEVQEGVAAFNVPDPMQRGQSVAVHLVIDRRAPEVIEAIDAIDTASNGLENVSENLIDDLPANAIADPSAAGNSITAAGPPEPSGEPARKTDSRSPRPNRNRTPRQIAAEAPGRTEEYTPQVGRFMRARLAGQGFTIVAVTPERQEIPRDGQARWTWQVTAREEGRRTLTLTTVAEALVDGRPYPLADTEEPRTVTVNVRLLDRARDLVDALPGWLKGIAAVIGALGALVGAWFGLKSKFRRDPPAPPPPSPAPPPN